MGRKKETKPLLDKSKLGQTSQKSGSQIKKGGKAKGGTSSTASNKPSLASVHENSSEGTEDMKATNGAQEKCPDNEDEGQQNQSETCSLNPNPNQVDEHPRSCSYSFGVRSYLHHFYETVNHPSPGSHEEDYHYLIHPKGRKCGALWFKIGLIIGATLFLLGAVAIVIGYAIPKQNIIVGRSEEFEVVDKDAIRFNKNLDMCKLIGLAAFCSGGLVLVISLLAPTFTSTYWEDDPATEPFRVSLSAAAMVNESEQPKSPIPATEKIKCVQPVWSEQ